MKQLKGSRQRLAALGARARPQPPTAAPLHHADGPTRNWNTMEKIAALLAK